MDAMSTPSSKEVQDSENLQALRFSKQKAKLNRDSVRKRVKNICQSADEKTFKALELDQFTDIELPEETPGEGIDNTDNADRGPFIVAEKSRVTEALAAHLPEQAQRKLMREVQALIPVERRIRDIEAELNQPDLERFQEIIAEIEHLLYWSRELIYGHGVTLLPSGFFATPLVKPENPLDGFKYRLFDANTESPQIYLIRAINDSKVKKVYNKIDDKKQRSNLEKTLKSFLKVINDEIQTITIARRSDKEKIESDFRPVYISESMRIHAETGQLPDGYELSDAVYKVIDRCIASWKIFQKYISQLILELKEIAEKQNTTINDLKPEIEAKRKEIQNLENHQLYNTSLINSIEEIRGFMEVFRDTEIAKRISEYVSENDLEVNLPTNSSCLKKANSTDDTFNTLVQEERVLIRLVESLFHSGVQELKPKNNNNFEVRPALLLDQGNLFETQDLPTSIAEKIWLMEKKWDNLTPNEKKDWIKGIYYNNRKLHLAVDNLTWHIEGEEIDEFTWRE